MSASDLAPIPLRAVIRRRLGGTAGLVVAAMAMATASFAAPPTPPKSIPPKSALPKSTPISTIQAIYAALPRPTPPDLLSRRLRLLVRRDEARRERNLDFEWRSGGQDRPDLSNIRLHLAKLKPDAAVVEASFFNRGERRFRRFFLVREAGRWVVDDVLLVPENGKLADFLVGKG